MIILDYKALMMIRGIILRPIIILMIKTIIIMA